MKEKHKRKSKNQSYSKRFVIIAVTLVVLLILSISIVFFYLFEPCCTEVGLTATSVVMTNVAIPLLIGETETQNAKVFATMTAEAP